MPISLSGSLVITGSITTTGGITISGSILSASYSDTASFSNNFTVLGDLTASTALVTGTITAQTLVVQTVTSSIVYSSGSNVFGSALSNTQTFTGSLQVTGSTHSIFGNVVIGNITSVNPSAKLEVKGESFITPIGTTASKLHLYNNDSTNETYIYDSGSSTNSILIISPGGINKSLVVSSSGHVGIGTTNPSQKLEVVGGEIKAGRVDSTNEGGQLSFGRALDNNTSWYIDAYGGASSPQLRFVNVDNSVVAMTITGSSLGIGTSSPIQRLDVVGRGHFGGVDTPYIDFKTTDTTGVGWQFKQISFKDATNAELYAIGYIYPNLKFDVAGSRVLTLTNTGHAGIGVIPSSWASGTTALQIGTTSTFWNRASDGLTVLASNSYFDGSADKQITTNTSNRMYFVNGGTHFERATSTAAGSNTPWVSSMVISANGNIGAPSAGTNIYNASDLRLKRNIATITDGLNKVMGLNPVKFNWIHDFETTENDKNLLGFIAQEVQTVIPEAVESFSSNSITIGETIVENPLRVNEKFIIPVLVKAIQELSTKLDQANTKIEALEAK